MAEGTEPMKCPNCGAELAAAHKDGVDLDLCPSCQGMWLTPQELDQLETEVFDLGKKGTLVFNPEPSSRRCPVCQGAFQKFHYRDYDLELEFCADGHGFWLDAGKDQRVLQLMRQEEASLERTYSAEDSWAAHLRHWRSRSFLDRLRDLLG
jgi:Zn-finger nucleic acid-binding protein